MAKRRAKGQIANLTSNHKKSGITLIYLHEGGFSHTIGKLSMKDTTFLETSSQLEFCKESYGPPKLWKSQFREFWDFQLGSLGTK
jgi:hypothetical protein